MKLSLLFIALSVTSTAAFAAKPCEELKSEIAAKIDANHVANYTLEVVATADVGDRKVVGSCDGGSHKIVYERGAAAAAKPAAAPAEPAAK